MVKLIYFINNNIETIKDLPKPIKRIIESNNSFQRINIRCRWVIRLSQTTYKQYFQTLQLFILDKYFKIKQQDAYSNLQET